MKKLLLDLLICPSCLPDENALSPRIVEAKGEDIITGDLTCRRCDSVYSIRDGIAFIGPALRNGTIHAGSKYETAPVLSSYIWSHYCDLLLNEENASDAYNRWADLLSSRSGIGIDAGSAVGRFTFEMSDKSDFAVGIDNSLSFIKSARALMKDRRITVPLQNEGYLSREMTVVLPEKWDSNKVEFIVGDAQAMPFKSQSASSLASLNLIDKVPAPLKHLKEVDRVAKKKDVQLLFSDPFSWSTDVTGEENWLGGKNNGLYSGSGVENIIGFLRGEKGDLSARWKIEKRGSIWWKIRTHSNHYELIRSCFIKANR